MEFIEIDGVRVQVPQDVVVEGRDAIAAWANAEAARRGSAQPSNAPNEGEE